MSDIIAEGKVRARFELTIPVEIREILNLKPGDYIRFEQNNGHIYVYKAILKKINNNIN
ncbi:MAG: AbrB/MazE/SpoVT family DNA-binding domain-containing protein [Promethearchaeota archaeon]